MSHVAYHRFGPSHDKDKQIKLNLSFGLKKEVVVYSNGLYKKNLVFGKWGPKLDFYQYFNWTTERSSPRGFVVSYDGI